MTAYIIVNLILDLAIVAVIVGPMYWAVRCAARELSSLLEEKGLDSVMGPYPYRAAH